MLHGTMTRRQAQRGWDGDADAPDGDCLGLKESESSRLLFSNPHKSGFFV